MSSTTVTKQDRVINYLLRGKSISQSSAESMFDVANLRATISDIKPALKSRGYNIVTTTGRLGETRYAAVSKQTRKR